MTIENENTVKITVHAKLIAKQGKVDELLKALEHWTKETREEVGCEYSELLQNIDNPSVCCKQRSYSITKYCANENIRIQNQHTGRHYSFPSLSARNS